MSAHDGQESLMNSGQRSIQTPRKSKWLTKKENDNKRFSSLEIQTFITAARKFLPVL